MGIDIERLKVDREYWDSVAPEDATHFAPEIDTGNDKFDACWMKFDKEWRAMWAYSESKTWGYDDPDDDPTRYIPRPEPRKVERDGLPESGVDCEMQDERGIFIAVHIIANFDGFAFGWSYDLRQVYFSDKPEEFRPIRTKEQREREELACLLGENMGLSHDFYAGADAILAKYNLEPKQ